MLKAIGTSLLSLGSLSSIINLCTFHLFYKTSQGEIIEVIWTQQGWHFVNLNKKFKEFPKVKSNVSAYCTTNGTENLFFYNEENHIFHGYRKPGSENWHVVDLTIEAAINAIPAGDLLSWCLYSSEHVFFNATDGSTHEIVRFGITTWRHRNLSLDIPQLEPVLINLGTNFLSPHALSNSPSKPSPSKPLFSEEDDSEVTSLNHQDDLSLNSKLEKPDVPSIFLRDVEYQSRSEILPDLAGNVGVVSQYLYYFGVDENLYQLTCSVDLFKSENPLDQNKIQENINPPNQNYLSYYRDLFYSTSSKTYSTLSNALPSWKEINLFQVLDIQEKINPVGAPFSHSTYLGSHVFFLDNKCNIHEISYYFSSNKWTHINLTEELQLPPTIVSAKLLTFVSGRYRFVFFIDEIGKIHQLRQNFTRQKLFWRYFEPSNTLNDLPDAGELCFVSDLPWNKEFNALVVYFKELKTNQLVELWGHYSFGGKVEWTFTILNKEANLRSLPPIGGRVQGYPRGMLESLSSTLHKSVSGIYKYISGSIWSTPQANNQENEEKQNLGKEEEKEEKQKEEIFENEIKKELSETNEEEEGNTPLYPTLPDTKDYLQDQLKEKDFQLRKMQEELQKKEREILKLKEKRQ